MPSILTIIAGPARKDERFNLAGAGPFGIGKFQTHLIRLMTPKVSRNHAVLRRRDDGGWRIEDQNSTNGVFANGQRIASHDLFDGDVIRIGEFVLRFNDSDALEMLEEVSPAGAQVEAEEELAELMEADLVLPPITARVADASLEPAGAEEDLYDLVEPEAAPAPRAVLPANPIAAPAGVPMSFGQTAAGSRTCMSCGRQLPPGAKICVTCGIDLTSGKSLVTSRDIEDDVAIRADTWIRIVSWILPVGLVPIASEAFATKKPYATWIIFALTFVCSTAFFIYMKAADEPSPAVLNLMHWTGSRAATDQKLADMVEVLARHARERDADTSSGRTRAQNEKELEAEARAAAAEIEGAPQGVEFHWYQLFTCALLHGGIMHIAGNMLFLLVFGLRVNELVGSLKFAIIYPFLAGASSYIDHLAHVGQPLQASLGASGAIMGLAGMYLVFFPVQRVHLAIWMRLRIVWMAYKVFAVRGFWLLVIWIAFNDLLPMWLGAQDHVAHWAHLGGFAVGVLLAVMLLATRTVDAHHADLLTLVWRRMRSHAPRAAGLSAAR